MTDQTITMHIETDIVRQHPFHLGTQLSAAETFVAEHLRKPGVKSISLRQNNKIINKRIYDYRDLKENGGDL